LRSAAKSHTPADDLQPENRLGGESHQTLIELFDERLMRFSQFYRSGFLVFVLVKMVFVEAKAYRRRMLMGYAGWPVL
jgi:hypothetical protein